METKLKKHEVYKVNTEEVDFSDFRVLLVYANSPMDNLFAVGLSSIAGMLKKHNIVSMFIQKNRIKYQIQF